MSLRELPDFLTHGDAELEPLMLGMRQGDARMRAMMGMGRPYSLSPMLSEEARAWLRHVKAGRIGGEEGPEATPQANDIQWLSIALQYF